MSSMIRAKSSEHAEQVAVIEWARLNAGRWPELAWLYANPNGAALPKRQDRFGRWYTPQARKLLAEGMLPGVSDLFLPAARGGYHGLYVEMKYGKNTVTPEQRDFLDAMTAFGYQAVAAWGADQDPDHRQIHGIRKLIL